MIGDGTGERMRREKRKSLLGVLVVVLFIGKRQKHEKEIERKLFRILFFGDIHEKPSIHKIKQHITCWHGRKQKSCISRKLEN